MRFSSSVAVVDLRADGEAENNITKRRVLCKQILMDSRFKDNGTPLAFIHFFEYKTANSGKLIRCTAKGAFRKNVRNLSAIHS